MPIQVPTQAVSVQDAVETYLFNSQLLSRDDGSMMLVLPQESHNHQGVWRYLSELVQADNPIDELRVFDLRKVWPTAGTGVPATTRGVNAGGIAGRESGGDDERHAVQYPQ